MSSRSSPTSSTGATPPPERCSRIFFQAAISRRRAPRSTRRSTHRARRARFGSGYSSCPTPPRFERRDEPRLTLTLPRSPAYRCRQRQEAVAMPFPCKPALAILFGSLLLAQAAQAQRAKPPGFPDAPGKEVLVGKCFQCHAPTMWQEHRQAQRRWESVLYRMVGRGALWTEDEIGTMADYLAAAYGRQPAAAAK